MYALLFALPTAYAVLLLLLWWQQERLVFPGAGRGDRPLDAPAVAVQTAAGPCGPFRLAHAEAPAPAAVVLFCGGNREDLRSVARRCRDLADHGLAAFAPEYPGYGRSAGRPGVAAILGTAEAAAAVARRRAAELGVPLVVGGASLGSFPALHLAARGGFARCLLLAPPLTMQAAAAHRYWWLPTRWLLRHRFDNTATAAAVRCPLLIVHGGRDAVVPLAHGEALRALAGGPAELLVVPGAGHHDLPFGGADPVAQQLARFLAGR